MTQNSINRAWERAAFIALGVMIGLLFGFAYSEMLGGLVNQELTESLATAEDRAISAEVAGKNALLKVEASGKKVYQLERLIVSEKAANADLKRRLGAEARKYKQLQRSIGLTLQGRVDSLFIPIAVDSSAGRGDSHCLPLPASVAYQDSAWLQINGAIVYKDTTAGLLVNSLTLNTGEVRIDDVTPKKPFSLRTQPQVVRLSVESPYFSALTINEYTVARKKVPAYVKILGAVALFGAGFIANSISQ